jgi:integrase
MLKCDEKFAWISICRFGTGEAGVPKHHKYERRIFSFDEAARVLARLEVPNLLVIETCIATDARISEVLGLKWRNVNLNAGTIKIEQRAWHQDLDRPKTENSRGVLGIGDLVERYKAELAEDGVGSDAFVFQQRRAPGRPLWDPAVRDALHQAAEAEGCDFPGLGPHSFRRANISWRQQVGGNAIEASKIAGHRDLKITSEYTFVTPEHQNELTRRIQEKFASASNKSPRVSDSEGPAPETPSALANRPPPTTFVQ